MSLYRTLQLKMLKLSIQNGHDHWTLLNLVLCSQKKHPFLFDMLHLFLKNLINHVCFLKNLKIIFYIYNDLFSWISICDHQAVVIKLLFWIFLLFNLKYKSRLHWALRWTVSVHYSTPTVLKIFSMDSLSLPNPLRTIY